MFSMFRRRAIKEPEVSDNLKSDADFDTDTSWTSSCASSYVRSCESSVHVRGLNSINDTFDEDEPCYSSHTTFNDNGLDRLTIGVKDINIAPRRPSSRGLSPLCVSDLKTNPMLLLNSNSIPGAIISSADRRKSVVTLPSLSTDTGRSADTLPLESPKTAKLHSRSSSDEYISAAAARLQSLRSGSGRSNAKYLFECADSESDDELAISYESAVGSLEGEQRYYRGSTVVCHGFNGMRQFKKMKFEQTLLPGEGRAGCQGSDVFVPIHVGQDTEDSDDDEEISALFDNENSDPPAGMNLY
jgi:hypothetical protein